ncbi:MAG: MFS transporter [Alphaproteobacteria bacterium]|jgi:MFS family permease|nr:MFS transporter [Alphaproteobacteria bacterium]
MAASGAADDTNGRFWRFAGAGMLFQGGAAAVDSGTIVASLVHGLTGSPLAVGAASAVLRYGWLFPQLFVGYLAQRRARRMPFYAFGAFGRAGCLALIALLLGLTGDWAAGTVVVLFFVLWTAYAFVSGIVAVPYNDIIGRAISSHRRSRLLALRFFGGGVLALAVAAAAHALLSTLEFRAGYAAVVLMAALLMLVSSFSFVSAGEIEAEPRDEGGFGAYLGQGLKVFRGDARFRRFVFSQWLGGLVMMALPFYVIQATELIGSAAHVALLLAAHTAGALTANALWGWWGDSFGKFSLYLGVAVLRGAPPRLVLCGSWLATSAGLAPLPGFLALFVVLGALSTGTTIATIGTLMEISPDDLRPAYSGYFNAIVAPAALLPLAGAAIAEIASLEVMFAVSLGAAALQTILARKLG